MIKNLAPAELINGIGTPQLVEWVRAHRSANGSNLKVAKDAVLAGWRPVPGPTPPEDAETRASAAEARLEHLRTCVAKMTEDISQTLGKALGYPWFKDDQANFPGTTEADGVCVGEHVAESLADEAAARIVALQAQVGRLVEGLRAIQKRALDAGGNHYGDTATDILSEITPKDGGAS